MPSLFELMYSGENALHITLTNFCTIDLSCAPEIQSILRCESSVLEKEVDNPRRYCLSSVCNQVVVTNGTVRHVLSIPTGYYSYLEFIEAVGSETVKVLPLVSMTIEEEYANSMFKKKGGILIVKVTTRRWMVLIGLLGSNCLYPYSICVWSILWMVLCSIQMVRPCLMW